MWTEKSDPELFLIAFPKNLQSPKTLEHKWCQFEYIGMKEALRVIVKNLFVPMRFSTLT